MGGSLELVPLLETQRELYEIPPGRRRFDRYLEVMVGSSRDIELPLALFNPMAKPHAAAALEALLADDAEGAARSAIDEALARLPAFEARLRVALVLVDDLGGGWTNRHFTELGARLGPNAELARGWVTVLVWTGETPSRDRVRRETLGAIYRAAYVLVHGAAARLGEIMAQEGPAAAFAGDPEPDSSEAEIARTAQVIEPHRDSAHLPTIFSALYGDEAARSVGYDGLGLPPLAGYALALREALDRGGPPELALSA